MSVAQYVVTGAGLGAIVWVLWYFLASRGPVPPAASVEDGGVQEVKAASPHKFHE